MKAHAWKALMAAAAAAAMLGTGGIASASSPTCNLTITSLSPYSPEPVGVSVSYSGYVTVSPSSAKMDHFILQVQNPATTGKTTVYTSPTGLDSSVGYFKDVPYTRSGSGNTSMSAHVYGPYVNGSRWTTDCKVSISTLPANQLPEVPWSAGLPLILGAGVIIVYRRRRALSN